MVDLVSDSRERAIADAVNGLVARLAEPFDDMQVLSDLATDCARLLGVASAGVLLADRRGVLHVAAASSERTRSLELFQLQRAEGPCLECFRSGAAVVVEDLQSVSERWPRFAPAALAAGMASVHAIPMRLLDDVLGTLGLFGTTRGALDDDDMQLGHALAHVAGVVMAAGSVLEHRERVVDRLQSVLNGRVVVEQAKGVIAQDAGVDMEEAFTLLRRHAQAHHRRLTEVAEDVVSRQLSATQLTADRSSDDPPVSGQTDDPTSSVR